MSKGLEALNKLVSGLVDIEIDEDGLPHWILTGNRAKNFSIVEKELKRLEIQDQILHDLKANHIEFIVEDKGNCYFKIKNTKGKERSYTSYSFIDFWRQVF